MNTLFISPNSPFESIGGHDVNIICAENLIFGTPAVYSLRLNMIAALYKVPLVLRLHMYPASELQIELTNQLMWEKVSCVSKSVAGDCFQKGTAIEKLLKDYSTRKRFINAGLKTVEDKFTAKKQFKNFINMLKETIPVNKLEELPTSITRPILTNYLIAFNLSKSIFD